MAQNWPSAFYNLTFVNILRSQGHSQSARELAEELLRQKPEDSALRQILNSLREEARQAFERFRNSSRPHKNSEL